MSSLPAAVPLPALTTGADGVLRSATFGDVYASREGGVAETQHVFLAGNDLPARWVERGRFNIGELGFGTGLNFLTTWRTFLESAPAAHRLHYIAFEQFPFTPQMLRELYGDDALAQQLIARYPLRLPGIHRVEFERVTLTLCFGDAREMLPQLAGANVDAWYLDGFAPAKNPELWGEALFPRPRRGQRSGRNGRDLQCRCGRAQRSRRRRVRRRETQRFRP
ncbi:MAG: tRNA (5-methylaminomethyl-2-thiouridine)(34)-methyltransferase MnmD [Alphaproteobacteria bacterium]